jgi:hypothetical protein
MDIAEILKARKKSEGIGFIAPIIEEQLMIDAAKENSHRRNDVFHPSAICYGTFCPREWLLCQKDPSLYNNVKFNVQQQKRFDVGKVMHTYVQDKLGNAVSLFGVWKCLRYCEDTPCTHFGFKPKDVCKKSPIWVYKEPIVSDTELNIRGNTDGIVFSKDYRYKYIFEYKTMNSSGFSTLCEPLAYHREQAAWYLDILSRNHFLQWEEFISMKGDDFVDKIIKKLKSYIEKPYDGAVIVYQNKDTQEMREYFIPSKALKTKEYMVDNKDSLHTIIENKKQLLRETLKHQAEGTLCDRLHQCDSVDARRAKICVAKSACFKGGN